MTKKQLINILVPAIRQHWEASHNKPYSEAHIYNAIKSNNKEMLLSKYDTMVKLGYIN